MTNNFQRILGKGGFGIVYYGSVNGTEQVAVKMLTHSSAQGYKQFKAEVHIPQLHPYNEAFIFQLSSSSSFCFSMMIIWCIM